MEGFLATRLDYLGCIWKLRYFWFSLVQNDLRNRYKRSFLGVFWSLVRPLAMTVILCIVFGKLFNLEVAEYAPSLLLGMLTWQFFTESILQGCHSVSSGSAYIRLQKVPLAIFPLRTVVGSGFHALVALAMGLLVTWFFRGSLDPLALVYLIPAIAFLFLLGWSLAILSGIMHTYFPDTNHLLEIVLQILFYITPILYQPSSIPTRTKMIIIIDWNPLTSVLALIRTPILEGTAPALNHILISLLFLGIVASLAVLLLRKLERTLIFWV